MSRPTKIQSACLLYYYTAYVRGWSLQSEPPFNMRTIRSLKKRGWLQGRGKLCNITSAGIKTLGCSKTAKVVATKSYVARKFQEQRARR